MYRIRTLNEIAGVIKESLPADIYEVGRTVEQPDAYLVRSANMHALELAPNVVAIARAGAGVNNIPVERCSGLGIAVFNTPGANANAVREMVICALLVAARNVIPAVEWTRALQGKGAEVPALVEKGKGQFVGPEIRGKTLGVLGLGAIGVLVANAAAALGMRVLGYDPYLSLASAWRISNEVKSASEEQIVAEADYITLHVPLTNETCGKVNAAFLAHMKPGATLLNFSRAELATHADVIAALAGGQLRNYVVDFPTADMIGVPGVICLPHLGASTPESEDNCAAMAAAQLAGYLEDGNIKNSVNFPDVHMPRCNSVGRLAVVHRNVPKTIGRITSALAHEQINIANMISASRGEVSYTLLDLDAPTGGDLRTYIAQLPDIVRVRAIR